MKDPERIRQESMEHFGFGIPSMKKARICNHCGKVASAKQAYCNSCGSKLPKETVYEQYRSMHRSCQNCGTVLTRSYGYCPQCGTKQSEQTMNIN